MDEVIVNRMLYTREEAIEAILCLRKHNHSIPDDCLAMMREVLLKTASDA